jgi:DNA-binding transcriptional LysR family regulator
MFERNSGVARALRRLVAQGAPPLLPTVVTNSLEALKQMAASGVGIVLLCPHSAQQELQDGRGGPPKGGVLIPRRSGPARSDSGRQRAADHQAEIPSARSGDSRRRSDFVEAAHNLTRIYASLRKRMFQFVETFQRPRRGGHRTVADRPHVSEGALSALL